ncbi:pyruvate carboxylase [Desulfosporosinus acidiphilus SJ4]|uniref:Pyruvate carboxylase n=1 Tax=Desulfosporosinus acidiphilus (strain DSM 22704 / JCM 16185 / SJ4) TaxID=646529 RepID=I4D124_DESAJ|nr:carboxyl transferase domain-containing protein [Desulfosporosinus acidiphilus]AFM39498.1 pyruvate carboxylase [Desulfosporosinus acidiphilus SJ4]
MKKILIANRGEIAIRIARAAADLNMQTLAVFSEDDAKSLHQRRADECWALKGTGAAAYLDQGQIISIAKKTGCDAIHPGYGFLSENASFARFCETEGITFIGPSSDILKLFGDKVEARFLAKKCNVPLLAGTLGATSLEEVRDFFLSLGSEGAVMIKAVLGGGGRGMRAVYSLDDLEDAYAYCSLEAKKAFGSGAVYAEQLIHKPQHIEIQIIGDGKQVIHLGERDCTMQRRNQKLMEIAPCPTLSPELREKMIEAALRLAQETRFNNLGTFEFLVDRSVQDEASFVFMEANPRLQVEHTVTEEVTGIDLVRAQIEIAGGKSLSEIGLKEHEVSPKGYAIQLRINTETIDDVGSAQPMGGTIRVYEVPAGPGIRIDGYGYSGYAINPAFDSLLAKLIVTSRSSRFEDVIIKARRILQEFRIEGVATNIPFLLTLLSRSEVVNNDFSARFIEENACELISSLKPLEFPFFEDLSASDSMTSVKNIPEIPAGTQPISAPMMGNVVSIAVFNGDPVRRGQTVAVIEAMKMEHEVKAPLSGYVRKICINPNDVLAAGDVILYLEEAEILGEVKVKDEEIDLDAIRPDLAEVLARHAYGLDSHRNEEVAKRHNNGQRTARENIQDLCDPESFIEYGALTVAAQRKRRPLEELIRKTPGDGLVGGFGSINGSLFGTERSHSLIMAYDFMVMAGTQGAMNHKKMDRMIKIAHEWRLPTVLFAEGGGGRPGDVDANGVTGLDLSTFSQFAGLSGKVPLIGIASGFCFAGNAALLGCCDVIIATKNSNIGMGGPAMIEGGGLGIVRPQEIGPMDIQTQNGVVDIEVTDEKEAVETAKKYLGFFQGTATHWEAADQRLLRRLIPENRLRVYEIRKIIEVLADRESVLELRPRFGLGMITALIRIEGRPFGLLANNPKHDSGAIEAQDADKAARFLQLCNVHRLPVLSLVDTPGFMVGPDMEAKAQVRHVSRMFMIGSHLTVPFFTVVLRKGYGLGAMAMSAGGFQDSFFTAAWPSGEFGAMGLEGAVKHAYRKELESIADPVLREEAYQRFIEEAYEKGKAINVASYLEIDSVIDPADTRRWVINGLKSALLNYKEKKSERFIDTW